VTKRNPTIVIDLELTQPFPDRPDLSRHADALVLCRLRGTPVAAVRAPIADGKLASDLLVRELLDAHAWAFAAPLAERAIADGRLPGWIDVESFLAAANHPLANGPIVTLAVCGKPGDPAIDRCVASIQALDYRTVEVMFVSADDKGRRRAVADGRGDIVVFVDGRAALDSQWVSRVVQVFLADPDVMAVTGLTLPRFADEPVTPTLVRQWHRRSSTSPAAASSQIAGRHGTVAYWRTAAAALPQLDIDAVLTAGYTVVYEPSALTWTDTARPAGPVSASTCAGMREAVRTIDLAEPLHPIADATQDDIVRLAVSWHGLPIGSAQVQHSGAVISPLWQTDAITQQLAAELLDAGMRLGRRVVWASIVTGLARALAPKIAAAASRRTSVSASAVKSPDVSERSPRASGRAA
jgi:hypothetical protein